MMLGEWINLTSICMTKEAWVPVWEAWEAWEASQVECPMVPPSKCQEIWVEAMSIPTKSSKCSLEAWEVWEVWEE